MDILLLVVGVRGVTWLLPLPPCSFSETLTFTYGAEPLRGIGLFMLGGADTDVGSKLFDRLFWRGDTKLPKNECNEGAELLKLGLPIP